MCTEPAENDVYQSPWFVVAERDMVRILHETIISPEGGYGFGSCFILWLEPDRKIESQTERSRNMNMGLWEIISDWGIDHSRRRRRTLEDINKPLNELAGLLLSSILLAISCLESFDLDDNSEDPSGIETYSKWHWVMKIEVDWAHLSRTNLIE